MSKNQTEQIAELIETNTRLTSVFLEKEEEINSKMEEFVAWKNSQNINFSANEFYWGATPNVTFPSVLKAKTKELNVGGAYDSETGVFTAPIDGTYMFCATVFVSTFSGANADGSKANYNDKKWHEDILVNLNHYLAKEQIFGTGKGANKLGEMWIGEDGGLIDGDKRKKWHRKSASTQAIKYLKRGEKVCLEFQIWNEANTGDKVSMSYNFSGTKIN